MVDVGEVTFSPNSVRPEVLGRFFPDGVLGTGARKLRFIPVPAALEVEVLIEEVDLTPRHEHIGMIAQMSRKP